MFAHELRIRFNQLGGECVEVLCQRKHDGNQWKKLERLLLLIMNGYRRNEPLNEIEVSAIFDADHPNCI